MKYYINLPKNCTSDQPYFGLKEELFDWLNENIGERDKKWYFPEKNVLVFVKKDDATNFALSWT
jgi:hypothetical protein